MQDDDRFFFLLWAVGKIDCRKGTLNKCVSCESRGIDGVLLSSSLITCAGLATNYGYPDLGWEKKWETGEATLAVNLRPFSRGARNNNI